MPAADSKNPGLDSNHDDAPDMEDILAGTLPPVEIVPVSPVVTMATSAVASNTASFFHTSQTTNSTNRDEKILFDMKQIKNFYELTLVESATKKQIGILEFEVLLNETPKRLSIVNLNIDENYQRSGMGSMLMHQVSNFAKNNDFILNIDGVSNSAWRFYQRYFKKHHAFDIGGEFNLFISISRQDLQSCPTLNKGDVTSILNPAQTATTPRPN